MAGNRGGRGRYLSMSSSDVHTGGSSRLVDAGGLLDALFAPECRPTVRWVRQMQSQRRIPYIKIGRLVRFDVGEVRKALADANTVKPL